MNDKEEAKELQAMIKLIPNHIVFNIDDLKEIFKGQYSELQPFNSFV